MKRTIITLKSDKLHNSGFTLVELLVTLFIVTTVSLLSIGIVWISLKSTVKLHNQNLIRQNGNSAMLQMIKMLQFARVFQGVSINGTTFDLTCQKPGSLPVSAYNYVRFTSADEGETTFACLLSPQTISSNSASLIDANLFKVTNCSFSCTQSAPDSPYTVGIKYNIEKKVAGNIFDEPMPLTFQNSATIRNLSF